LQIETHHDRHPIGGVFARPFSSAVTVTSSADAAIKKSTVVKASFTIFEN
jgi:hypothetical protein